MFVIKRIVLIISLLNLLIVSSCKRDYAPEQAKSSTASEKEQQSRQQQLEKSWQNVNKVMALKEKENILSYFSRQNIDCKEYHGVYIATNNKNVLSDVINENCKVETEFSSMVLGSEKDGFSKQETRIINTKGDTDFPFGLLEVLKVIKPHNEVLVAVPSALNYVINDEGEKIGSKFVTIYKLKVKKIIFDK